VAETVRIENEGVGLHVEVEGPEDAVPVVFLHGVTVSGRTWEWLPGELKRGRRIVRIDFRGHGSSDHAPGTYHLPRYGGDVVTVLRALAAWPAVLVGHSLGGVVAWWVLQNHPELVTAAFLEDPPLYHAESGPEGNAGSRILFEAIRADALAYKEEGLSDEEVVELVGAMPMGPPGVPTLREISFEDGVAAMGFSHRRLDIGVIDGAIDGSTLAGTDTTSPVTPPVAVVAADDAMGAAFTTADAARLAETHPAIEVIRVLGSGHLIHDERRFRETFSAELGRFLAVHAPPV